MISTIIFSEGSPMRVEALLQSINKNANYTFTDSVVIYKSDSLISDMAYDIVQKSTNVVFKKTGNFKEDVVIALESTAQTFVCFLSDSDIFFRNIENSSEEIIKLFDDQEVLTFNFRLGINVTKCYITSVNNKLYGQEKVGENSMKFDWQKHYLDFAMPYNVHGGIYRTQEILKMIKKIKFDSAQEMEDALYLFQDYPKNKMASFIKSALVTIPTPEIKSMVKGNKPVKPEDHKQISEKFMAGERIDLDAMDFAVVDACFVEKEYKIKNITVNV